MAAVRDVGQRLVEGPGRLDDVSAVGLDETAFLKANSWLGVQLITGVVDLKGSQLLRSALRPLRHGRRDLAERPPARLGSLEIEAVALDPFRGDARSVELC
jgi:hypothetical protein